MQYSQPEEKIYDEAKQRFGKSPDAILAFPLQTMAPERFADNIAPQIIKKLINHIGSEMDIMAYSQQEAFGVSEHPGVGNVMTLFFIAIFSKKNPKRALDRLCMEESGDKVGYTDIFSMWRAYKVKTGATKLH